MNLSIQTATEGDIPTLRDLAERIWRAHYPGIIPHAQIDFMLDWMYAPDVIRREMTDGVRWELVRDDDRPIGLLACTFDPAKSQLKLNKIYILQECHGAGIGQQLLAHVKETARRLGARQVHLQVNKANTRAIKAYERAGFRTVAAVVSDIGHGFVMDDFIMAWEVAP